MRMNEPQMSATIYQFPVGGRAGMAPKQAGNIAEPAEMMATSYSEAWYHQEAIVKDRGTPTRN